MRYISLFFLLFLRSNFPIEHMNFFEPYEWLLDLNRLSLPEKKCTQQLTIRGEYGFNFRGYPVDPTESLINNYNTKTLAANSCQYIDQKESLYSAFLGQTPCFSTELPQRFTRYNGLSANERCEIKGDMSMVGITAQYEFWFRKNIKIGYYLPFYSLQVKQLTPFLEENKQTFESEITNNILTTYQAKGTKIRPYKLEGLGDSMLLVSWQQYFYENRDFITGLLASLRIGLLLPTAFHRTTFIDTFLKIPLGYDAAWGIPFGGSIELDLGCYAGAGISADCIAFFERLADRYIKTDMRQSDMLSIQKAQSLLTPGFKETFSAYLTAHDFEKTVLGTIAYQYNKQNESDIILCDSSYVNLIAQTSEFLESWTAHNLLFTLASEKEIHGVHTLYNVFFKLGFHGMRSIVANTFGFQITASF